jgi:hypothetical protein
MLESATLLVQMPSNLERSFADMPEALFRRESSASSSLPSGASSYSTYLLRQAPQSVIWIGAAG